MLLHLDAWLQGCWQSMATIRHDADRTFTLTYDSDHAMAHLGARDARAASAAVPVTLRPVTFDQWPAFLRDLLPQGESRKRLARRLQLPDSPATDWQLLQHGGGNPVGHLRIREAAEWLQANMPTTPRGWTMDEILDRDDSFLDALGPYPGDSPQGEWPKVMLTESRDGLWYLDHELPDAEAVRHCILKLPRRSDPVFDLILQGEAAYHAVALNLGLTQGQTRYLAGGALLVERFDRVVTPGAVTRIAQESLYAATGCLGSAPELTHREACRALARVVTDPQETLLALIWRDMVNLALGNRDNHGRNTAVHRFLPGTEAGHVELAPVFDLAPMFLHPDGIVRRMRWGQENGSRPDWRLVAERLDEDELLPQAVFLAKLPDWEDTLARLPALLREQSCPDALLRRLEPVWQDCLRSLREAH